MRFSIIIPTYNYGHYLPRAIDSALAQGGDDFEVIVVDDGSSDNTPGVIKPYLGRLRYIRQSNKGPGAARNRGMGEATGEYLIFLDADDRLLPDALDRFRQYLSSHPNSDLVFGGHVSVSVRGVKKNRPAKRLQDDSGKNFTAYIRGKLEIPHGAAVMHHRIFEMIHYPESIRNNEDMVVKAQALALFRCASFPEPVVEICTHTGRQRDNINTIKTAASKVVDLVFNKQILPAHLLGLRDTFMSRHLLSRSRSHYLTGDYVTAIDLYCQAIKVRPVNIIQFSYLRKFLRSIIKGLRTEDVGQTKAGS